MYFARNIDAKKNVKFFIFMIILTLTLVSGLRNQLVGIDTQGYVNLISRLRDGYRPRLNNITEQGFILLSYILVNISSGYTLALMVYSLVISALIILRLYDYRDKISFTWAVFIYYMLFYFSSFNTIRQWMATAVIFYGTRYIGNNTKSIIRFLIFVVIAITLHTTSIFAILFIPLYFFALPSKNRGEQIRKLIIVLLTALAGAFIYSFIIGRYRIYINAAVYGDISWVNIVLLLFACFILLYDNNWKIVIRKGSGSTECDTVSGIRYETMSFLLGIALALMVFLTRYADRLSEYFLLFEIVFFSYYIKKEKTRTVTMIFVLLLCVFIRVSSFLSSGYGEVPYIPFWA